MNKEQVISTIDQFLKDNKLNLKKDKRLNICDWKNEVLKN